MDGGGVDLYELIQRLQKRHGPTVSARAKMALRFLCVCAGLAVLMGFIGVQVSSRPKFCTVCHYMKPYYESWANSSHKDVPCLECHYPPGLKSEVRRKFEASVQVTKYVTRQYGTRPWTEIDDASCLRSGCHDKRLLAGTVAFGGIRFNHVPHMTRFRRVTRLRCTSCHSQIVQGTHMSATPSTCYLCHFKGIPEEERLAECTLCHDLAEMNGKASSAGEGDEGGMDHTFVVERNVNCVECHENVVRGDGFVAREVCETCHAEPERVQAYDDKHIDLIHANHVTDHKIDCTVCHQAIEHGTPEKETSKELTCSLCHPGHHKATESLYAGHGVGDLTGQPDPMHAAGVRCVSCHRTHREVDGEGVVMDGGAAGCMNCHGESYGRKLAVWRMEMPKLLSETLAGLNEARRRAKKASAGREEALRLCKEAHISLELVRQGNGVHNVAYARDLLKSAAGKANAAMALIGNPYRVAVAALPAKLAESKCLVCHDAPPKQSKLIYGVSFSHERHVTKSGIACEQCHGAASLGDPGHGTLRLSRAGCRTCHARKLRSYHAGGWLSRHGRARGASCRVCHTDSYCSSCHIIPMPHTKSWKAKHGAIAAERKRACRICHKQSRFCIACHGVEMPHGDNWVLGEHGKVFRKDQDACAKCHKSNECATCHDGVLMPHPDNWLSKHGRQAQELSTGCGSCHQPSDCLLCHKPAPLPSHAGDWAKQHSERGQEHKALCALCHGSKGGCKSCHEVEMPHPDNWIMEGHKPVSSFRSDSVCFKCHGKPDCETCHEFPDESEKSDDDADKDE